MSGNDVDIESLLAEARELVALKAANKRRLDSVVLKGTAIVEKMNSLQSFQQALESSSQGTTAGTRRQDLLGHLQHENKLIRNYQEENRDLRETVEECLGTIELIMQRHRQTVLDDPSRSLAPLLEKFARCQRDEDDEDERSKTPVVPVDAHMKHMAALLLNTMEEAEQSARRDAEELAATKGENRVLRELLSIAELSTPGIVAKFNAAIRDLAAKRVQEAKDGAAEEQTS